MKPQCFIPLTIVMSVALLGLTKVRKKDIFKEERQSKFQNVKMKVAYDVLTEYQKQKTGIQEELEKAKGEIKPLEEAVNAAHTQTDKTKGELDACEQAKKPVADQLASVEAESQNVQAELDKEKASWTTELETLKQQLAARSAVCGFLKAGSQEGSKLCSAPKEEEPKAEAPKEEEPKAEAPKEEEPKAEAPKQEEPKAEAPKQEEPKAEAPK